MPRWVPVFGGSVWGLHPRSWCSRLNGHPRKCGCRCGVFVAWGVGALSDCLVRFEDVRNCVDGLHLVVWHVGEWCRGCWLLKEAYYGFGGVDDFLCWCGVWHSGVDGKKFNGVADAFRFGFIGEYSVTAIMFYRWSQVPSVGSMGIPSAALCGFFVDQDFRAWWSHGCFVKIKGAFKHGVGGDFRVASRRAEKIKGYVGLFEESVP